MSFESVVFWVYRGLPSLLTSIIFFEGGGLGRVGNTLTAHLLHLLSSLLKDNFHEVAIYDQFTMLEGICKVCVCFSNSQSSFFLLV